MPKLDTITIQGFKSIASIEQLKLDAVNIVIGANGSGKSNFIEVFSFLRAIREGKLQEYVTKEGGADKVLHFGSKVTRELKLRLSFENGVNQYKILIEPTASDQMVPTEEAVYFWDKAQYPQPYEKKLSPQGQEAGISDSKNHQGTAKFLRTHLTQWRVYHFHDTSANSPMKRTADINDNRYLRPDGSNLAAFLYFLKQRHETSYDMILQTVQSIAPFFKDFLLEPQRLNPEKIRLEWCHRTSDAYFDAASLSDGTLRFIALATLFLQPDEYRPSVILVDEPELGLHPFAITILAALIHRTASGTQVIASTQSSLLLDQFDSKEVLVAERVDGSTQIKRLDSARLADWLEDYSLGQLWEKDEIGGRPS